MTIISPSRVVPWNPGLYSVGGIPVRNTVHATLTPRGGGLDDTAAIQAALDACPANQVVLLSQGDYIIASGPLLIDYDPNGGRAHSNITLRGAGTQRAAGGTGVRLFDTGLSGEPTISLGSSGFGDAYYTQPIALTADGNLGDFTIQVASNPGWAVGELVVLSSLIDSSISWFAPGHGTGGLFCLTNRPMGQTLEVKSSTPTSVTFTTPLYFAFKVSFTATVSRLWAGFGAPYTAPLTLSGVENLYITGGTKNGGTGVIGMTRCKRCWISNVEINSFHGSAHDIQGTFQCESSGCYNHDTTDPNPGGGGYAYSFSWYASDNLIENCISWNVNKVEVGRSTGGGNVWGYNYFQDGWGAGYPTIDEVGMNSSHYPTSHMDLFEGNEAWDAESDIVWGNSVYITHFRNYMTGRRLNHWPLQLSEINSARHCAGMGVFCYYFNYVCNVLGTPGAPLAPQTSSTYEKTTLNMCDTTIFAIWMLGWGDTNGNCGIVQPGQANTAATVYRHGNWDSVTNTTIWDPSNPDHSPPNSFYLTSKPAFFGSNPWPWVTPENAPTIFPVGAVLPAKVRFQQLAPQPYLPLGYMP